jgi:predicted Zn-dependent peptidase
MDTLTVKEQIVNQLDQLTPEQLREVLDFAETLVRPHGEPGELLLERTRDIRIDPEDLEKMRQVIEEECERIDPDEW